MVSRDLRYQITSAAVFNVVLREHSPDLYVELFRYVHTLRRQAKLHGDRYAEVTSLYRERPSSPDSHYLQGIVSTFTNIDGRDPWYDKSAGDAVSPSDQERLSSVAAKFKPKLVGFRFCLNPTTHTFSVEVENTNGSVGVKSWLRFWTTVLTSAEVCARFGDVQVHLIANKETLEEILASPRIRKIVIDVSRPNPDSSASPEARFQERLKRLGAKRQQLSLTAENREHLVLDEDTKDLARIATANGSVLAVISERRPISTKNHAQIDDYQYIEGEQTPEQAFLHLAKRQIG